MRKVFPKATATAACSDGSETVLTVWKKSMLLNCEGFTVFNGKGDLVYRVDNYTAANKGQTLLMDAAGNPLFTIIRRKRLLSLAYRWVVYEGETAAAGVNVNVNPPRFSGRKQVNYLVLKSNKCLARVDEAGIGMGMYEIEGCYRKRCCSVYDEKGRIVAEIKPKEAAPGGMSFGMDVFRLVVQPDQIDAAVAMALLLLLDLMFAPSSSSSSTP